ncbi:MAG: hypothetical protein FWD16_08225, partial [Clostridia bacterium]|nr:hypothetical protein [Clostridia bacterium]
SYVFAPMAIYDAIVSAQTMDIELALVDKDAEMLEAMSGYAQKAAEAEGVCMKISAETDRCRALPGADFIILCAAVQGQKRWETDRDILVKHGLSHQARECGGVAGLSSTLRQIKLAMDVASDMKQLCPQAILLDVANPMPRVLAAVNNFTRITAYGFCQAATGGPIGYPWFARLLGREIDEIDVVTAGLNHFAWLLSIREKSSGRDLYADVLAALKTHEQDNWEWRLMLKWYREYGLLPAGAVSHHAEHLPPDPDVLHDYANHSPFHGGQNEREARLAVLREIAEGKKDYHDALQNGSWEHPVWFADALYNKKTVYSPAINIRNEGYIQGIPAGVTVEAPILIENGKVVPRQIDGLPPALLQLLNNVAEAQTAAVRAGVDHYKKEPSGWAEKAIDADFAIPPEEKERAKAALREMMQAHYDIIN